MRHPGAEGLQEIQELNGVLILEHRDEGHSAKVQRASLDGTEALEEKHSLCLRDCLRQSVWGRNTLTSLFLQSSILPPELSRIESKWRPTDSVTWAAQPGGSPSVIQGRDLGAKG